MWDGYRVGRSLVAYRGSKLYKRLGILENSPRKRFSNAITKNDSQPYSYDLRIYYCLCPQVLDAVSFRTAPCILVKPVPR